MTPDLKTHLAKAIQGLAAVPAAQRGYTHLTQWAASVRPYLVRHLDEEDVKAFDSYLSIQFVVPPRPVGGPNPRGNPDRLNEAVRTNDAMVIHAVAKLRNHLQALLVLATSETPATKSARDMASPKSNKIFIVHGHDQSMKVAVARTIEMLGLVAVIFHEQTDQNRTIIQKLQDLATEVVFAVVLLSPDDLAFHASIAGKPIEKIRAAQPRARQNVIYELGYFTALLGEKNVLVLKHGKQEILSDLSGVLYTEYTPQSTEWKYKMGRELQDAGYAVKLDDIR